MSEADSQPQFERIRPQTPSSLRDGEPGTSSQSAHADGISAGKLFGGVAILLLLGAGAILGLPQLLDRAPESAPSSAAPAKPETAGTDASPNPKQAVSPVWENPELLRARAAAQELRKAFDAIATKLKTHGVEHWGASEMSAAQQAASAAQEQFDTQDFSASRDGYAQAVDLGKSLLDQVDVRLKSALEKAQAALASGNQQAAIESFERALQIDPESAAAQRGLERANKLEQVIAKLGTARRLEQIGDQSGALSAYRAALELDPDTSEARRGIERIESSRRESEFQQLMGRALSALDQGNLEAAANYLGQARNIRPSDHGLNQASARLAGARAERKLAALQDEANAQITSENWAGALATLESALKVDPTIAFARQHLSQVRQRAELATQLQTMLNQPTRLQSSAVRAQAAKLLAQARAVPDAGPLLTQQISALGSAINAATRPISVRLQSDNQTLVTIYKVGKQGAFADRSIELVPGKYVAVGERTGYRDVRVEFVVSADTPPIDIRCTEPL